MYIFISNLIGCYFAGKLTCEMIDSSVMGGSRGGTGSVPPWKITSGYSLVQTPNEKQLDPSSPIASRGRSVHPSVKDVDD